MVLLICPSQAPLNKLSKAFATDYSIRPLTPLFAIKRSS